jgi:hypothetical protein
VEPSLAKLLATTNALPSPSSLAPNLDESCSLPSHPETSSLEKKKPHDLKHVENPNDRSAPCVKDDATTTH